MEDMIYGLVVGLIVGFVAGALVFRKNATKIDAALAAVAEGIKKV